MESSAQVTHPLCTKPGPGKPGPASGSPEKTRIYSFFMIFLKPIGSEYIEVSMMSFLTTFDFHNVGSGPRPLWWDVRTISIRFRMPNNPRPHVGGKW